MVTDVVELTAAFVALKPHAVEPEPTVTLEGTLTTAGLLLDSDTSAPPAGAAPESETNPDVGSPPVTLDGLIVTLCKLGPACVPPVTVRIAVRVEPLKLAVMVTEVFDATGEVVTANVAVKPLGAIVAVAGTLATAGLLLDSVTVPPSV